MPISKRLRYEIFRRDDFACRYCGGAAPDVKLTIDVMLPGDWGPSILRFCDLDMLAEVHPAVDVAMPAKGVRNDKVFAYFCGVMWRKYREREAIASELISAEEAVPESASP